MADLPLVSIVTPSYNQGQYLEETICSVLSQDYPRVQYIVMDGGSGDGSLEILRRYEGRLKYVNGADLGQGDAINRGFEMSRGTIFAFLNADDLYLPGAIRAAVEAFERDPLAGAIYGRAYVVDDAGHPLLEYPTSEFDLSLLQQRCFICQPACFIRSRVFRAVGMVNHDFHSALDYELWMRISKLAPMQRIDRVLAHSRLHMMSKTVRQRELVYRETIGALKNHYGYVPFPWIYDQSCCLLKHNRASLHEPYDKSVLAYALSLFMGSFYNADSLLRFWAEWGGAGLRGTSTMAANLRSRFTETA